jgi:hypothetical protein
LSDTLCILLTLSRFGNFIGEAGESEEESQHGNEASAYVYDEYPEEEAEVTGQELMDLDGTFFFHTQWNMRADV